jgi:hypothetical protein
MRRPTSRRRGFEINFKRGETPNEYFEKMKRSAEREAKTGDNESCGMVVCSYVASLKGKEGRKEGGKSEKGE